MTLVVGGWWLVVGERECVYIHTLTPPRESGVLFKIPILDGAHGSSERDSRTG